MKIAITGATGFIGTGLTRLLTNEGHEVTVLSRDTSSALAKFGNRVKALKWAPDNKEELVRELDGTDGFVNLAGENIGSSLWTRAKRRRILESRLAAGRRVGDIISSLRKKPGVLVQASAVGIYGSRGDEPLDETSPPGHGFLAEVVERWENSTREIEAMGVRRIIIRTGVVFAPVGGALPKIAMPYKFFLGTVLGSGRQWVPWIDYRDELDAIRFLLTNNSAAGIYNLVSPIPSRMGDVCRIIGETLRRPTLFNMPGGLLKIILGKMAEETILPSQNVVSARLKELGFEFQHPGLKNSINELFRGQYEGTLKKT